MRLPGSGRPANGPGNGQLALGNSQTGGWPMPNAHCLSGSRLDSPLRGLKLETRTMPNDAIDLAFARHVRQIGLVTQEQVNAALQSQASSVKEGKSLSFSEVLVQMGLITPAQRETLEKK